MSLSLTNWARNLSYSAKRLHEPASVEEVRKIVAEARKVKALGTRHSFNDVADCEEDLISLSRLDRVIGLDTVEKTVTIEGGVKYGHLAEYLNRAGWALQNMASLPHISVAGACATATHGSGDGNGNLATAVTDMEIVNSGGEVIEVSRKSHGDRFEGMIVSLGALGVAMKLKLRIIPAFQMRQDVYENLPWGELERNYDAITRSAYSVSMFTNWRGESIGQVWLKKIAAESDREPPREFFGATLAHEERHPISGISPRHCTTQRDIPGPWHERLPHFRMEYTPSNGEELQSEYFVPRENAVKAFAAVRRLADRIAPVLQITELRTVAADSLWMSPCYRRDCTAIHFTWKADWHGVQEILPVIEAELLPLSARPHWGKLFTVPPRQLQAAYEKTADFRRLITEFDPDGKFRNAFLDRCLF